MDLTDARSRRNPAEVISDGGGERILDVNLSPHGTAWVCPDVRLELDIESSWFGRDGEPGEVIACSCG